MAEPSRLNPRQQAFIAAYVGPARFNATKAAITAGYSEKTAKEIGAENLTKPLIALAIEQWRTEVKDRAIAQLAYRVDRLNDLESRLWDVIEERGEDLAGVPGGKTGLLTRQVKQIGHGRDAETVEEYAVDVAVIKEIRSLHEQAAKELGQWSDKLNITHTISKESAQQLADEFGLDPLEVLAEAETILRLNRIQS